MIAILLVVNILCGLWNSILSTSGSTINAWCAAFNWVVVGLLITSLIRG